MTSNWAKCQRCRNIAEVGAAGGDLASCPKCGEFGDMVGLPPPKRAILYCPHCHYPHIDDETGPPHLMHRCEQCRGAWKVEPYCFGVMLEEAILGPVQVQLDLDLHSLSNAIRRAVQAKEDAA